MSNTPPYIISPTTVTVYVAGRPLTASSDHPNFDRIVQMLSSGNCAGLVELFDIVETIGIDRTTVECGVDFDPVTGTLTYNGWPIGGVLVDRILELSRQGVVAPVNQLLKFLDNLYQNPSSSVVDRLYTFLEKGNMPITDDGHFLAYKRIRADWTDVHSGTMDNSIGKEVTMPRSLVNDNDNETCSTGLHFCSFSYLSSFGGDRVVALKINPRDVVSIPTDYNDAKGRCCRYVVLEEITERAAEGPVWGNKDWVITTSPPADWSSLDFPFPTKSVLDEEDSEGEAVLSILTGPELVSVYNSLCAYGNEVTRFRDRATGISRILKSFDVDKIMEVVDNMSKD
jgi:hypothetical protein